MSDCIFCKVIARELPSTCFYQDDEVMVIKDIHPQAPVHWLVIPKKHIVEFIEADALLLSKLYQIVKKVIDEEKISNYRIVANGKGAALIDHLHIHVMGGVDKMRTL